MSERQPSDQEMRQMLVQLHDELERAEPLDEDERAMLRHLMGDIQEMLARSEGRQSGLPRPNQGVLTRMEQAVDTFEVTNPSLTLVIKQALDTLNIAGI